jgi:exosortase D (VPLPA-CTERM-specific)
MQQTTGAIGVPGTQPQPPLAVVWAAGIVASLAVVFLPSLAALVGVWENQQEYSYGYVIPLVFAFLIYQRLTGIADRMGEGSWAGVALVSIGLVLALLGRVSTLDTVAQYGFLLCTWGVLLALLGWAAFRWAFVPMLILAFMVPIPNYLLRELSAALQLLSSRLGVEFIRWCGVSVYLEGNVIDLGTMKLQVVEACSGLRYLFSLLVLSFLVAYFYKAAWWKRGIIFLSALPITVLMNSVRIGVVGVTVDRWGKQAAEGLLHDFEGVTIFLGCVALLVIEIWLLTRLSGDRRPIREVLSIDVPTHEWARVRGLLRAPGRPAWMALGVLVLAAAVVLFAPQRTHARPERPSFSDFPMQVGSWQGYPERLDPEVLGVLKLDDYLLANYFSGSVPPVNLYVSYYASQTDGNSAHSPRACIPGDGWEMRDFAPRTLPGVAVAGGPLEVNRTIIQKGERRALVYYWFQQRGHFITGEYAVKLRIFSDSLSRGRTDGAMVRLVTAFAPGETLESADGRLAAFAAGVMPALRRYVPE